MCNGFRASVWKYKCTDCAHYFCSSHCKDLWLRADDVDEDEEDPFTVLKDEEAPVDASELPFPHGDGASVVSSVAPSAAGSSSGSKSSTRLLCIECYAPRRMALLRAELYHTLDDLEELSAHVPDAGADGAWKYLPSLAAITPDAVSSGANVVSTAVGPQRRDGHGAPKRHQFRGLGGALWCGAQRKKKCCEHRSFCRALRRHPRASHHHDQKGIQLFFLFQDECPRHRAHIL